MNWMDAKGGLVEQDKRVMNVTHRKEKLIWTTLQQVSPDSIWVKSQASNEWSGKRVEA